MTIMKKILISAAMVGFLAGLSGCVNNSATPSSDTKRFTTKTVNGDTLLMDNTSGLTWTNSGMGCKPLMGGSPAETAQQANAFCRSLSFGGFKDWRLSTVAEMTTLETQTDAHGISLFYKNPKCKRVLASNGANSVVSISTSNNAPVGRNLGHKLPSGTRCVRK